MIPNVYWAQIFRGTTKNDIFLPYFLQYFTKHKTAIEKLKKQACVYQK